MKKALAVLLCLLAAALPWRAVAEDAPGFYFADPFEDHAGATPAPLPGASDEFIRIEVGGESLQLAFDRSPDYSSVKDGMAQASFYGYGGDGRTLYELYVIFPETTQAGMVFTPDYAALTGSDCSVTLIVSGDAGELYYTAGLMDGSAYPLGSDFSIAFDVAEDAPSGRLFSGTLDATLIALDLVSGKVVDTLPIDSAPFRFTIGAASDQRSDPLPTEVPKDMRRV